MKVVKEIVDQMCDVLYEKKALDIVTIDIADKSIIADYFIVCSGRNFQQVKSLCDELDAKMSPLGITYRRKEGYNDGRWIVMDYEDVLIHIFHPEERQYYNLERLWKDDTNYCNYSAKRDAEFEASDK